MDQKKVIYISGPITGVPKYYEAFERVDDDLTALGCVVLSPARLPEGMTGDQYRLIKAAMIRAADEVWFLPGHEVSKGSYLELQLCKYLIKPHITFLDWKSYESYLDKVREVLKR